MSNSRVIILTHNTLEAIGLKGLLRDVFAIDAHIADDGYFSTFNQSIEPHLFFIDKATLVANLAFYLPRKSKTIVLTTGNEVIEDMKTLNCSASESEIISAMSLLLETNHHEEEPSSTLSSREIEVLRLIALGKINKEIAQELNISINTVLTHRKNLTAKLGIKSVSGLSFYAMMNGIV